MSSMNTITRSLSAAGVTTPTQVFAPAKGLLLLPSILVFLSAGASLTYQIEVTGDNINVPGYDPSTGHWVPFTNMVGLTAAAANTLGAAVSAIRANITAYTSGTLTFQFTQTVE